MADINDIFGTGKAIEKLINSVGSFIGDIKQPLLTKWMAQAKAEEIKVISEAIHQQQGKDLDIKCKDGKVSIKNRPQVDLLQRAQNRLAYQEITKQENIEAVVSNARQELDRDGRVSDQPVDKDWINRFFSYAGDFSSEEIRILWGKLLAGEIRRPNSISLRTLDVLHNLSIQEAILFNEVAKHTLRSEEGYYFLPFSRDIEKIPIVEYKDIVKLSECGLLNDTAVNHDFGGAFDKYIARNSEFVLISHKKNLARYPVIRTACYLLTSSGKELCEIFHNKTNNTSILQLNAILEQYNDYYTFTIHRMESVDLDGTIHYADKYTDIKDIQ